MSNFRISALLSGTILCSFDYPKTMCADPRSATVHECTRLLVATVERRTLSARSLDGYTMSSSYAILASCETPYFSRTSKQCVALQNVPPGEDTTIDAWSDMLHPMTVCIFLQHGICWAALLRKACSNMRQSAVECGSGIFFTREVNLASAIKKRYDCLS